MTWIPLRTTDGTVVALSGATVRWTNSLDAFHAKGDIVIERFGESECFRLHLTNGLRYIWVDGERTNGPAIVSFCIHLPSNGMPWEVKAGKFRSTNSGCKGYASKIEFKPNLYGLTFLQVVNPVAINDESSPNGEVFGEGLIFASSAAFHVVKQQKH